MQPKILLVYNAEEDAFSRWIGFAHKIVRPSTYRCELCALTYGWVNERESWKKFRNQTKMDIDFAYLSEFRSQFGNIENEAPLALMNDGKGWRLVLEKRDFQSIKSVEDLILRLSELTSRSNLTSV